jgi:hypothetical protein
MSANIPPLISTSIDQKELLDKLAKLPLNVQKRHLLKVVKRRAKPILAAAKSEAPYDEGHLRDGLEIVNQSQFLSAKYKKIAVEVAIWTNPKKSKKGQDKEDTSTHAYYVGMVHWGHKIGVRPERIRKGETKEAGKVRYRRRSSKVVAAIKASDSRGSVPPNKFLERAYASQGGTQAEAAANDLRQILEAEAKKGS